MERKHQACPSSFSEADYRCVLAAIERWASNAREALTAVVARAPARAGESGALLDAAASLARSVANSAALANVDATAHALTDALDACWYDVPLRSPLTSEQRDLFEEILCGENESDGA